MSFYCLELSEKQLLQAPNDDAVILNGCFSCASSKVDDIITLISSSWSNKTFQDCTDTVFGSYYELTQLQKTERVNNVWDLHMKHRLKDDNENHFQVSFPPGNKDSGYQPSSCLPMPSPSLSHCVT